VKFLFIILRTAGQGGRSPDTRRESVGPSPDRNGSHAGSRKRSREEGEEPVPEKKL